jgi:hypothetical protein
VKHLLAGRRQLLIAAAAAVAAPAILAGDPERRVRVALASGSNAQSFEDTIIDFEVVSYVVPLQQGQSLRVLLATNNASNCFDVYAPGISKPIYVGDESGNSHQLLAQASGDYVVKVYLLRLAARDGQTANYTLELKLA